MAKAGILALFLTLREMPSIFIIEYDINVAIYTWLLLCSGNLHLFLFCFQCFYHENVLDLSNEFSSSIEMIQCCFSFYWLSGIPYWLTLCDNVTFHSKNKIHLLKVCHAFNVVKYGLIVFCWGIFHQMKRVTGL